MDNYKIENIINYYNGYKQGIYEYTKEFEDERIKILRETKDNDIIESLGWIPGVPVNSNNILRVDTLLRNKLNNDLVTETDLTGNSDNEITTTVVDLNINKSINSQISSILDKTSLENIWMISDWHLFKLSYGGDIEDRAQGLINKQKEAVKDEDVFIYLGDIVSESFKDKNKLKNKLKQLNGTKILVLGNHDEFPIDFYKQCGFEYVVNNILWDDYIFTHAPIDKKHFKGTKINIHGHIHFSKKYWNMNWRNHIDVFTDANNGYPINLYQALINYKKGFYDGETDKRADKIIKIIDGNNIDYMRESEYTLDEVLNDKNKFYDWVLNTDETIEDLYDKEPIEESYIFSEKDLYINFDKFESGQSNILLITGLSGSGKSTIGSSLSSKYKAEIIELDIFEHNNGYSDKNLMQAGEVFYEYFTKERKDLRDPIDKLKKMDHDEFSTEIKKFLNYVLKYCNSHKDKKFIIEGVQIYSHLESNKIKGKPIILVNTSVRDSILRRFRRNSDSKKIDWRSELKNEFPQLLLWYINDEKEYNKFKKEVLKEDYDINEIIDESYIFDKKDLYINFDKFESGESNILLITGLSGSGKSTLANSLASKYKADVVELDKFFTIIKEHSGNKPRNIKGIYTEYFNIRKDLLNKVDKMNGDEFDIELKKFFDFAISYANKNKDKKIIIEGVQLYMQIDSDKIKSKPIILIGASVASSLKNSFKRYIDNGDIDNLKDELAHLPKLLKWYFKHESQYKQLKQAILKEEYIEEKLSYKERQKLKDSDFGIPKLRKYPLHDEGHVRAAIKFFNHVDKKYEKELAQNIIKRMNELNLYDIEIGKDNKFYDYYQKSIEIDVKENFEYIIEEANKRNEEPIYILLTKTGSTMSKAISTVLGDFYTHVSLSFDLNMNKIYAFDKNGFIIEELQKTYKNQFGNIPMAVYCIFMNKNSIQMIKNRIDNMMKDKKKYRYNYLGALGLAFEKPVHINNSMFCSEFVDQLLKFSGNDITGKNSGLVTPQDFKRSKLVYKIYEGTLNRYSITRAQKNLSKLRSRIFTESYITESTIVNEVLNITKDDRNDWHTYANEPIGGLYNLGPCDQGLHNYLKVSIKPNLMVKDDEIVVPNNINYGDELTLSSDDMEYIIRKMHGGINRALPIDHPDNKCPNYTKSDLSEYLDESCNIIEEAKEFPIQFDKDGSLIVKNIKKLNFEEEYQKSHKLLLSYDKTNNYEGMKYELSKLWYMNIELERRIYNSNRDESKLNGYTRVRARILNDFNKYIKIINKKEKDFNFSEYYEESPFNDGSTKLRKSTLDYLGNYLKQIIKNILI